MKKIFIKIFLFLIVPLCGTYSQNRLTFTNIDKSNALIETYSKNDFFRQKKIRNENEKRVGLNVVFKNNPFQLDDSYKVILIINRELIYDGVFVVNGFKASVPIRLLDKKVSPKVVIYKKNKFYTFTCDQSMKTISKSDNLIHIVFMPDNDAESIYFVATDWKVHEN